MSEIEEEDKSLELPDTDEILSKTVTTEQRIAGGGGGGKSVPEIDGGKSEKLKTIKVGHDYALPDIKEGKYDKLDLPDLLDIDEISSKNDEAEQKLEGRLNLLPEINGGKAEKLETTLQTEIIILESSRSEETAESEATKFWIKELQVTQEDKAL